jgi:hypothetical protein
MLHPDYHLGEGPGDEPHDHFAETSALWFMYGDEGACRAEVADKPAAEVLKFLDGTTSAVDRALATAPDATDSDNS